MEEGVEIQLVDPRRKGSDWTELLRPTQCAVFLKDAVTLAPLRQDGTSLTHLSDASCTVFDRLDAAQQFCEDTIQKCPNARCEIYDAQGLALPPLVVVMRAELQQRDALGALWSRRRKGIAVALVTTSMGLFWLGAWESASSILFVFLGINCIIVALRFLHWDSGVKDREKERLNRLELHRRVEQAQTNSEGVDYNGQIQRSTDNVR